MRQIPKPTSSEHVAYVRQYIDLLPDDGLVLEHLRANLNATSAFLRSLPEDLLLFRYAADKWTIKGVSSAEWRRHRFYWGQGHSAEGTPLFSDRSAG
jgi:hypothetical protein